MNLQQYIASKTEGKQKKISADTISKWSARNGTAYAANGAAGAQQYMSQYAKTAAAPKVIDLGRLALATGNAEFAAEFFRRAAQLENITLDTSYELASDTKNPNVGLPTPIAQAIEAVRKATVQAVDDPRFPSAYQPGRFAPMQPVDAKEDLAFYIGRPSYWGQPKKDGNKLIVFASSDNVYYQSRQMKLNGMPNVQMDNELRNAARELGNFICEGELTYLSFAGREHRTASQAQRFNAKHGRPEVLPVTKFYIFNCVWQDKQMLRMYSDMVNAGYRIATFIQETCQSAIIEAVLTAKTADEKATMALIQKNERREGEVWFQPLQPYRAGKVGQAYVRTKYGEEITVMAVGFEASTAPEYAFGSMRIESLDGKDLGSVGNGFSLVDRESLLAHFQANGPFRVQVYTRGYTEDAKCWLASFVDFTD